MLLLWKMLVQKFNNGLLCSWRNDYHYCLSNGYSILLLAEKCIVSDLDLDIDGGFQNSEEETSVENKTCIFPFKHDGITYNGCTMYKESKPWCLTKENENGTIKDYGQCSDTCPMYLFGGLRFLHYLKVNWRMFYCKKNAASIKSFSWHLVMDYDFKAAKYDTSKFKKTSLQTKDNFEYDRIIGIFIKNARAIGSFLQYLAKMAKLD